LRKLARDGQLQQAERKRPGKPPQAVFHPGDVERVAKERNPDPGPFVIPAEIDHGSQAVTALVTANGAAPGIVAIMGRLAEALEAMSRPPQTPASQKLFLTLHEAADLSGLPVAHLRRLLRDGKLDGAVKTGGGWRVRRTALEQL
jgi:excisionase family DNA binding protein